MNERDRAILLANKVLDHHNADPDDDLAVLARQFLRAIEAINAGHAIARAAGHAEVGEKGN